MKALGGMKFCPKCKNFKPTGGPDGSFGRDSGRSDGFHPHCRICRRGYRLLRKPVPETIWPVNTERPRRISVPQKKWELFDQLADAGCEVKIVLPNGDWVLWQTLE